MTNEELANAIKAGREELVPVLWGQVQRFLYLKAKDWYNYMPEICRRSGVEQEDLEQETYFAFLDALHHWDPEAGYKFLTYTIFPIRNRFNALCGRRTDAQKKQPLNNCKSLYSPVAGEGEDLYLLDMIHDAAAEEEFREVEAAIYNKQLHDDLETCLATLPDIQRGVIRGRFYDELSAEEVGSRLGMTAAQCCTQEANGLRKLRSGKNASRLKAYREDIISRHFNFSGYGFWKRTGMSSTEYAVLKLERLEE